MASSGWLSSVDCWPALVGDVLGKILWRSGWISMWPVMLLSDRNWWWS